MNKMTKTMLIAICAMLLKSAARAEAATVLQQLQREAGPDAVAAALAAPLERQLRRIRSQRPSDQEGPQRQMPPVSRTKQEKLDAGGPLDAPPSPLAAVVCDP